MIHTKLQLTRPLIIFDTETTSSSPKRARIVELSFQLFTADGLQKEWRSLINPEMSIPPGVTAVHGISDDDMKKCRHCEQFEEACPCEKFAPPPVFGALANNIAHGFSNCDFGGKRIRYDLQVMANEMKRVGVRWSYANAHIIDIDRLEQLGEPRTLSDLHRKHLGEELKGAHGALADVQGTTRVLCAQLDKYASILSRNPAELHELQWPGLLCVEGQFKIVDGEAVCGFGKHQGTPMREVPKSYYQWIIDNDFPDDVKELARNAINDIFPDEPRLF